MDEKIALDYLNAYMKFESDLAHTDAEKKRFRTEYCKQHDLNWPDVDRAVDHLLFWESGKPAKDLGEYLRVMQNARQSGE